MKNHPIPAAQKLAAVNLVNQLIASDGLSVGSACRRAKVARGSYYKWRSAMESGALLAGSTPMGDVGRPVAIPLTDEEQAELRRHHLDTESLDEAVRRLLRSKSGTLTAETRAQLQTRMDVARENGKRPSWPAAFRRAAALTEEMAAQYRGPKATQDFELVVARGTTWIDEDGEEQQLHPLDLWESDDLSLNQPFRYLDPSTGQETTGRQTLATVDVYSAAFLGGQPIGRTRDAYRAEDILDHMRWLVESHGLPLIWRLERGVWESGAIDGLELDNKEAARYGLGGKRFAGKRWGGLDVRQGGPIRIVHTWSSRGKGTVESSFDHLQTILANRGDTIDLGRRRGEFERATKSLMQAHRGQEKALAKFWDIGRAATALAEAMEDYNDRPKTRHAFGDARLIPNDLLGRITGGRNFRQLAEGDRWRFFPVKRFATVRQSRVEVKITHWPKPFAFQINGVTDAAPYLGNHYRVLIALHPAHPEWGCYIFNAEVGKRNHHQLRFGQLILIAPQLELAPQVDLSGSADASAKSRSNAAMRTEFRAIGRARSISEIRNGAGVSQQVEICGEPSNFSAEAAEAVADTEEGEANAGQPLESMGGNRNRQTSPTSTSSSEDLLVPPRQQVPAGEADDNFLSTRQKPTSDEHLRSDPADVQRPESPTQDLNRLEAVEDALADLLG